MDDKKNNKVKVPSQRESTSEILPKTFTLKRKKIEREIERERVQIEKGKPAKEEHVKGLFVVNKTKIIN